MVEYFWVKREKGDDDVISLLSQKRQEDGSDAAGVSGRSHWGTDHPARPPAGSQPAPQSLLLQVHHLTSKCPDPLSEFTIWPSSLLFKVQHQVWESSSPVPPSGPRQLQIYHPALDGISFLLAFRADEPASLQGFWLAHIGNRWANGGALTPPSFLCLQTLWLMLTQRGRRHGYRAHSCANWASSSNALWAVDSSEALMWVQFFLYKCLIAVMQEKKFFLWIQEFQTKSFSKFPNDRIFYFS